MSGMKSEVAKRVSDIEPRALCTHCYGYSLYLAVNDTMKQTQLMKNSLETTYEICKLIKYSSRRETIFRKLKTGSNKTTKGIGVQVLCPTRCTVRADSLQSILLNYQTLMDTWEEAISICK